MRSIYAIVGLLAFGGGCATYVTQKEIPTGCPENIYYLDQDQDGWGERSTEVSEGVSASSCEPRVTTDETSGKTLYYTARNTLDCDDSASQEETLTEPCEGRRPGTDEDCGGKQVSGRVGSVCPDDLVATESTYAARILGTREYVAVVSSSLTGSASAANSCSEQGWGGPVGLNEPGGLAIFHGDKQEGMQGLFRLINELNQQLTVGDPYAAWVGVIAQETGDPEDDDSYSFEWVFERKNLTVTEEQEGFKPLDLGFCGPVTPDPRDFGKIPKRLALVRKAGSGDWCFGRPTDANGDEKVYDSLKAHFVCERPRPDFRCHVDQNEEPWLTPCSCRIARGESEESLTPSADPEQTLGADRGRFFKSVAEDGFDSKLCLEG